MNMNRKQAVVIKAPLLDGDNIPNMAMTATTKTRFIFLFWTFHFCSACFFYPESLCFCPCLLILSFSERWFTPLLVIKVSM